MPKNEKATEEIITLYDEHYKPIQKDVPRSNYKRFINPGVYMDVVNIVTQATCKGEKYYLITKRSSDKRMLPDYWEFTGGAIQQGEDSLTAAIRELREETGFIADKSQIVRLGVNLSDVTNLYRHIYCYSMPEQDTLPVPLSIPSDEVSEYKWIHEDYLFELFLPNSVYKFLTYQSYIPSYIVEYNYVHTL